MPPALGDRYDVAIIGGGVIGLSCAYALSASRDRSIIVIDAQTGSREASWAAGGMLAPYSEFTEDSALFRLCCDSADMYPEFVGRLTEESGLPCTLVEHGSLLVQLDGDDEAQYEVQCAFAERLKIPHERLDAVAARQREPNLTTAVRRALWFPERSVNNRQLWEALAMVIRRRGVVFQQQTPVEAFSRQGGRLVGVETTHGRIAAEAFVLATGAWTQPLGALLDLRLPVVPIKGQLLRFDTPNTTLKHTLHWNRRYLVPRPKFGVVVGATSEDRGFDWSVEQAVVTELGRDAAALIPCLSGMVPCETWAGLRPRLPDGLPALGRVPAVENLILATGHYRNGILLTPITGQVIADILDGRETRDLRPFSPGRFA